MRDGVGHEDVLLTAGAVAADDIEVLGALRMGANYFTTKNAYRSVLRHEVFSAALAPRTKDTVSHERTLLQDEAQQYLTILWKESHFVSDKLLAKAGVARSFLPGELTCHALALSAAATAEDLGKVYKRIQLIVNTAHSYGLISKDIRGPKKVVISGTSLLHNVMLSINRTVSLDLTQEPTVAPRFRSIDVAG
jgi:hypothetical protein